MSYAPQRDLLGELSEGMTDNTWKKVIRDRGGWVERTTPNSRTDLADTWYGIHEAEVKYGPDGSVVRTPNYLPTRPTAYPGG